MKKNFRRVVAFIMAVIMVLTMSNWSGIATVAKAASDLTVYYYNYNNGVKPLSGTITATVVSGDVSQDVTMTADTGKPYDASSTSNWYVAVVSVENTSSFTVTLKGSDSGDASVGSGGVGTSTGIIMVGPQGAVYGNGTSAGAGATVEAAFGIESGGTSSTTDTRIYFYNGANWANVYAYSYNPESHGSWPGSLAAAATDMGDGWYYADVPYDTSDSLTNLIFNNGYSGYDNGERKTGDLDITNGTTQYIVYTADSTDSSNTKGTHTDYTNVDEAKAAVNALTNAVPGTIYAYIPDSVTSTWLDGKVPAAVIIENGTTELKPWTELVSMGSAYPGWYKCTVSNINTITELKLANPLADSLDWVADANGAYPDVVSAITVTADSWTDGASGKEIAMQWGTATAYTINNLATELGLTEGYPGSPLDLSTYNVHVYNISGWESWVGFYWGAGVDATGVTGTLDGDWIVFEDIPAEMYAVSFGDTYDTTINYYPKNLGTYTDYYFYTTQPGEDTATEMGYATAAEAIAAANANYMVNVYFYQETDWDNAGIAYVYDNVEYFTAPAAAVEGCPDWYLTQVPAGATSLKVVQVAWSETDGKYVWGGSAATIVENVPNGNGADIAISQNKGAAYTVEGLAAELGQTAGYPGQPLPGTYDVWYYNPDWSGSSVYLNYRSHITGWTADASPAVLMKETNIDGWFFVDGDAAGIYQARLADGDITANAVQIFMTKGGADGNGATNWSDHYFYNKGIDGEEADFVMDADVLYLYAGTAYETSAALAAAAGVTETPDSDTIIHIYSSDLTLVGGYALNAEDESIAYTTSWDGSAAPWYTLTVAGVNAAAYPMHFGFGNWGTADVTEWESGSLYADTKEVYLNAETNVVYASKEALEDGLTSTFYIYAPDGMPADVTATHKVVDYDQKYMATEDETENITLEAATDKGAGWYKGTVSTDAVEVGYKLNYTYNGKAYQTYVRLEDAEIDAATGIVDGTLRAYYYAGLANDGVNAKNKELWTAVYADVFYYEAGTTEKVMLLTDVECLSDGDGWFFVDTGVSALDSRFENGVYVQFKSAEGVQSDVGFEHTVTDAGTVTAAYQFLNNYRVYGTSQMTIFKSKSDAIKSLKNTEVANEVPTDMVRVWYYFPGGWSNYYVFYSTAAGGSDPAALDYTGNYSQLAKQEAYVDSLGGAWYYADIPTAANYIYFDEDNEWNNGGNVSQAYDISDRGSNEIFCVVNDSIITNGWSTSTAAIARYYDLANVPASNEISMPVTILDYNADNLFFEYDMYFLRNMTMVLGNQGGWYGMKGMGISDEADLSVSWPTIDIEGIRPGDAPHYDRNGKEYVSGVLEDTLVNGYPVYTEQAVTYIAKVVERGMSYYAKGLYKAATENKKVTQSYNKTALFETLYKNITGDSDLNGADLKAFTTTDWSAAYAASKAKYAAADFVLSQYDIKTDTDLTCMDYAYYVMNNLYDTNSNYNKDYGMYSYLVLKRTSPNVYGFYANFETNMPTSYNIPQNFEIVYAPNLEEGKGVIYNNVNESTTLYENYHGQQAGLNEDGTVATDANGNVISSTIEGFAGLFPYNKGLIDAMYGAGTNEITDAPVSADDGYVNVDGNSQAETNFYRYYDYVMNGETVNVEYIDAAAYNTLSTGGIESNSFVTETRNYNYALKLSGKFRFDYDEDLYFTFTGDDDVVMYINGIKVLDLSGAHQAASYTVYLSDLVDDGIVSMQSDAYYDLDFFYMERHTTWSNMRIETNIDVIDVSGQVQKQAYTVDADGNKVIIPSGSVVDTNKEIAFRYELTAAAGDGLENLKFEDPTLGISISSEGIELGSYVDANKNTVERKVEDLVVTVGNTTYTGLTEEQLMTILEDGIDAGKMIQIENIKHVMTTGVDGPVTATMTGKTDGRELSSTASHVLFVGDPSISVTKTAANAAGTNLPNNTTVQSGTIADYTITATNTGGLPLHNLALVDEELGINFSVAEDGTVTAIYNREDQKNTEITDLVFTVLGTGVSDGIYTISATKEDGTAKTEEELQAELEKLVYQLTQIVYPTGASISVSGIKHPITGTCTSEAIGTADSLQNYEGSTEKGWEQFGQDYLTWLNNGKPEGTEPDYTDYVAVDGKEEVSTTYAEAYKAYIADVKENGFANATVPDPAAYGFAEDDPVTDNALLTLNAKLAQYNYYTQAGQTIDIQLQTETTVILDQAGTWGDDTTAVDKVIGNIDLTAGAHNITFYNNGTGYGYNVNQIVLKNTETGEEYVLNANTNGVISTGSAGLYDSGVAVLNNPGDSVTFPVDIATAGTYTATVTYISADHTLSGALVVDYMPGNYALTDEAGTAILDYTGNLAGEAIYTVGDATIVVNNDSAYPTIKYTYAEGESGRTVIGAMEPLSDGTLPEGVVPDTITVTSYDVTDDVYVLDYGLKVNLTDEQWNNGLFQNDLIDPQTGDIATIVGLKGVSTKIDAAAADYVYKYTDGTYTNYAIGQYGAVSANGAYAASADVIYELNSFLEGVDRYAYGIQVGLRNRVEKDITNSTPIMEANVTIMPASIVYYEDNFASVITNGTVIGGEEEVEISEKVWTTTWEDGDTHDQADYGVAYYPGSNISSVVADWYAYTLGQNIVIDEVNDIYYKLTSFEDPEGNLQENGNIFKYLDPEKQYVLRFKVINNAGERNFAIGAGIDAEGYAPDEELFYTTFRAGGNGATTTDIEVPIENIGEVDGRTLVLYLGPTSADPEAFSIASFYIADVEVVEKVEAKDMQSNSLNMQYGYDPVYSDDNAYTNNGYTVLDGTDKIAFTFQGTGFDILTRTANASLKVSVYNANDYELKSYTYGAGKTAVVAVKKSTASATAAALKTFTIHAGYENGTLDQVPTISVDMGAYGNYVVVAQKTGTENLHVDGIRIYNPITVDQEVSDAYGNAKGEEGAVIQEIREMIFGKGYTFSYTNPQVPSSIVVEAGDEAVAGLLQLQTDENGKITKLNIATGSTVVESYTGAFNSKEVEEDQATNPLNASSLLNYAAKGPNNELYLTGENYAFGLVVKDATDASMLQIGLKAVDDKSKDTDATAAVVQYRAQDDADGNAVWKNLTGEETLISNHEMYYNIDLSDLWQCNGKTVLLVRVTNGTVSLTNLKYNGVTFEKITPAALGTVVVAEMELNIISAITIKNDKGEEDNKESVVVTFSVSRDVQDFTITSPDGTDEDTDPDLTFTYDADAELPEDVSVSVKEAGDLNIYVVTMPKTAGTYTITTNVGILYGTAEFTIQ